MAGHTISAESLFVVLVTAPDNNSARILSSQLVERRLAACVNIIPGLTSIYRWQGKIEESGEVLLVIKTSSKTYSALEEAIIELHPYDLPEVVAIPSEAASFAYKSWVFSECGAKIE